MDGMGTMTCINKGIHIKELFYQVLIPQHMNQCREFIRLPGSSKDGSWELTRDRYYLSICNPIWKNLHFDLIAELRAIEGLFFVDFLNKHRAPSQ